MYLKSYFVVFFIGSIFLLNLSCEKIGGFLDKSGNEFVVEILPNEPNQEKIVERAISVTKSKIKAIGLSGEVTGIPEKRNQIVVKIYGSNDWESVTKFLFTAYQLELRKPISPPNPSPVKTYSSKDEAESDLAADQEILSYLNRDGETFEYIIVEKQAIITGEDISDAHADSYSGDENNYYISFSIKPEGAKKFGEWTGNNIGNYIAIVLDKKVQSVAYIKSQIFDQGQIDGQFSKQSAQEIALSLKSGYLPATMKVIEERPFEK